MKAFLVSWYASGYCVTFRYLVVANNLNEAKEIWRKFVDENKDVEYSWRKEEKGNSDKEIGCYKMDFDVWNTASDHLWD